MSQLIYFQCHTAIFIVTSEENPKTTHCLLSSAEILWQIIYPTALNPSHN